LAALIDPFLWAGDYVKRDLYGLTGRLRGDFLWVELGCSAVAHELIEFR
jgi:hypothetical protein